ncbi:MAG: hypothetical protein HZB10_00415 [Candidatus Yonathbacteria bacterium]|nr:hypothetical protein [Candidatus Yonathbacteria bacterium]
MPEYLLNGSKTLKSFMRINNFDDNKTQRVAAGLNIPVIHLVGAGQDPASFQRRITEAQAQSLADILNTTVANLKTNAGLVQLP